MKDLFETLADAVRPEDKSNVHNKIERKIEIERKTEIIEKFIKRNKETIEILKGGGG